MPLGSLSSVLEVKQAEGFKGAFVLASSLPVGGTNTGNIPVPPPIVTNYLIDSSSNIFADSSGNRLIFA